MLGTVVLSVSLLSAFQPYCRQHDFEVIRVSVDPTIHVLGFLNTGDVSSPPAFSRHLVLPLSAKGIGLGVSACLCVCVYLSNWFDLPVIYFLIPWVVKVVSHGTWVSGP